VLNSRDNVAGFYYGAADGGTFTNKAHKAYLPLKQEENAGVNAIYFNTADGISTIARNSDDTNAPAYNLAGQRVNASYNGVVIVNGKKVIRK
jgi:hypothetical protein